MTWPRTKTAWDNFWTDLTTPETDANDPVVALVDGSPITVSDLQWSLKSTPWPPKVLALFGAPGGQRQMLNVLIMRKIAVAAAQKANYTHTLEFRRELKKERDRFLSLNYQESLLKKMTFSNDELLLYYKNHPEEFGAAGFEASHIVFKSMGTAQKIQIILRSKPTLFGHYARLSSIDKATARRGGRMNLFSPGQYDPEIERALAVMPVGQISGVIRSHYGYEIVRKDGQLPPPFDSIRDRVLINAKKEVLNRQFMQKRLSANVQIDEKVLQSVQLANP